MNKTQNKGFTLIELMIVVAIIGILASIAYPSYQEYVLRAKRGDAKAALLSVQLAQEKWRANHTTYGSSADIGITTSSDGYYNIAHSGNTATAYVATATPTFTDANCGTFSVNQDGKTTSATVQTTVAKVNECWGSRFFASMCEKTRETQKPHTLFSNSIWKYMRSQLRL